MTDYLAQCRLSLDDNNTCSTLMPDLLIYINPKISDYPTIESQEVKKIDITLDLIFFSHYIVIGEQGNDFSDNNPTAEKLNVELWLNFLNHDNLYIGQSTIGNIVIP